MYIKHLACILSTNLCRVLFFVQNGGPTYEAANNLPLRGAKTTLWEGGTKGSAFVYSEKLFKKTKYTNTEYVIRC